MDTGSCEPNKPFPFSGGFGHGAHHSSKQQTNTAQGQAELPSMAVAVSLLYEVPERND